MKSNRTITARDILEAYEMAFRGTMGHHTEVFVNPTRKELLEIGDAIRFIADAEVQKIYVWNSDYAFHSVAKKELGINKYEPHILPGIAVDKGSGFVSIESVSDQERDLDYVSRCLTFDWTWTKKYGVDLDPVIEVFFPRILKRYRGE
jgi:hypothetical protein